MANGKKAVLLLGHGSKAPEANETLREIASGIEASGGYPVVAAFLQMVSPDIQEGVDILAGRGYTDIVVMPYFLYTGLHVSEDIPRELQMAKDRHPEMTFKVASSLGYDARLVDVALERISGVETREAKGTEPFIPHPIERESFRIIGDELDESGIPALHLPMVKRVIHTTADFEYRDILRISPGAVQAGIAAIRGGRKIVTDVQMVSSGIMKGLLRPFGSSVACFSSDKDVAERAQREGTTRTAASMRKAAPFLDGGIAVVGNAPTALKELLTLMRDGKASPALVIGVPVGFVGAVEAKDELMGSGFEHIATRGRKGGSTVAVALVNALSILASEIEARR